MGSILRFDAAAARLSKPSPNAVDNCQGSAEIILFPGVRVEYDTVDQSHRGGKKRSPSSKPGKRKAE